MGTSAFSDKPKSLRISTISSSGSLGPWPLLFRHRRHLSQGKGAAQWCEPKVLSGFQPARIHWSKLFCLVTKMWVCRNVRKAPPISFWWLVYPTQKNGDEWNGGWFIMMVYYCYTHMLVAFSEKARISVWITHPQRRWEQEEDRPYLLRRLHHSRVNSLQLANPESFSLDSPGFHDMSHVKKGVVSIAWRHAKKRLESTQ